MEHISKDIELLSPAGSPESLRAAVAAGADAVYLGLDNFSARARAVNFSDDNLAEHIDYCHIRGVRVYLTLNTILFDNELQRVYDTALFAYNKGIDAVILQDMGLLEILKKEIPGLELHASTQTSISNAAGAVHMASEGFSRVILAREMTLQEIKAASDENIKTEVFVHGARCYSYSGQCLMSSMLGGRSGNRGDCAQPCRLPYTISDDRKHVLIKGHLLSLKDTLYIDSLNQLRDAGVGSLKIEGRMKGPEYVAAVTSIYRKYLDMHGEYNVSSEDLADLAKAFNRSGFSKGALSVDRGRNEFSVESPKNMGFPAGRVVKGTPRGSLVEFTSDVSRSDGLSLSGKGGFAGKDIRSGSTVEIPLDGKPGNIVYITRDSSFLQRFSTGSMNRNASKTKLTAEAVFRKGSKAILNLTDTSGTSVRVESLAQVEKAVSGGTPEDRIKTQLVKTGGTPYEISSIELECEDDIFIRISEVNDLRRAALLEMSRLRSKRPSEQAGSIVLPLSGVSSAKKETSVSICFYGFPEDLDVTALNADRIYIDPTTYKGDFHKLRSKCGDSGIALYLLIPYSFQGVPDWNCDGYLIENHGMLGISKPENTVLGTGFNISNSYSLNHYSKYGTPTLSYELSRTELRELGIQETPGAEMIVYGKPQVMESPYCPARDICSGDLCVRKNLHLSDRTGTEWNVIFNPANHSIRIFNPHRLLLTEYIDEIKSFGVNRLRINILDETAGEVYAVNDAVMTGTSPRLDRDYKYTSSHFLR